MGIIGTIPLREKFRENPIYQGMDTGSEGPRGPSEHRLTIPEETGPGPYSWPPDLDEEAGP